jgi:hypothetical protein
MGLKIRDAAPSSGSLWQVVARFLCACCTYAQNGKAFLFLPKSYHREITPIFEWEF